MAFEFLQAYIGCYTVYTGFLGHWHVIINSLTHHFEILRVNGL